MMKSMRLKKTILLALTTVLVGTNSFAQSLTRYFLLDNTQQKNLKFNHVKCADPIYKAELFNVFYGLDSSTSAVNDTEIFTLFTALPDYLSKKPEWKEIKLDTIGRKLISLDSLRKQFRRSYTKFKNSKGNWNDGATLKSEHIKPVVRIGSKYYSPTSPTIMEHFAVVKITNSMDYINNVFPNLNQFFEINTDAPVFPLTKFENIYKEKFKHYSFNSHEGSDRYNTNYAYNSPVLIRGNNVQIAGKTAYKYWTLASWTIDGRNAERGIDRFAYIPGLGIVSGAYSYYFWAESDNGSARFLKNYLNDTQLEPYEINGKVVEKK